MKKKPDRSLATLKQAIDRELQSTIDDHPANHSPAGESSATRAGVALPRGARKWRLWAFLLLCLVGSAVTSFVIFKYVAPSIPRELVGTWRVTEGPLKEATLEFRWNGTAIATLNVKGQAQITDSTVQVEGDTILMTSKDSITGREDTVIQTILKLTEDELILRDEDRLTYPMKRIRN